MSEKWMRGRLRGSGHLVSGLAVGRNSPAQGMTGASDETFKPSLPFSTSGRASIQASAQCADTPIVLPLRLSVASPMPTVGSCQRSDAFSHAYCFLPIA